MALVKEPRDPEALACLFESVRQTVATVGSHTLEDLHYREPELWDRINHHRSEPIRTRIGVIVDLGKSSGAIRSELPTELIVLLVWGMRASTSVSSPASCQGSPSDPAEEALRYVSSPVLASARGLAVGFSAMVFSPLRIHVELAVLRWVTMPTGAILCLTLLPTVLSRRRT